MKQDSFSGQIIDIAAVLACVTPILLEISASISPAALISNLCIIYLVPVLTILSVVYIIYPLYIIRNVLELVSGVLYRIADFFGNDVYVLHVKEIPHNYIEIYIVLGMFTSIYLVHSRKEYNNYE